MKFHIQIKYPNGYTVMIIRSQITYPLQNTFDIFVDDNDICLLEAEFKGLGMRSNLLCYRTMAETNKILNKIKNLPPQR